MTKLEHVAKWALTLLEMRAHVNEFRGPWFPRHHFPQRDQVVIAFVNESRQDLSGEESDAIIEVALAAIAKAKGEADA